MRVETVGFDETPRVETWDSRREMLVQLEARGVPWIEVSPRLHPSDTHVAVTIDGITIAFATEVAGVTPDLVRFEGLSLWYLGWDTYVAGIDVPALTQVFTLDLGAPFFELERRSAHELLAIHELGLLLCEPNGEEIWSYDASDIITDWEILPDALRLTFWEEGQVVVDWTTGKLVGESI